jgi:hypothetical protein
MMLLGAIADGLIVSSAKADGSLVFFEPALTQDWLKPSSSIPHRERELKYS